MLTRGATMSGILTLIPTSIDELGHLNKDAFNRLMIAAANADKNIIAVEDAKPARRRWLHWGLPREAIDNFFYLNEHKQEKGSDELISQLLVGKNVFVLSDGGMPAFCDPGRKLVYLAHGHKIKVTSSAVDNSLVLAISLSGFTEGAFHFGGFPPKDSDRRVDFFKKASNSLVPFAFMDTPYRLDRCLKELAEHYSGKICLGIDLGRENEEVVWGELKTVVKKLYGKREFVVVLCGKHGPKLN